MGSSVRPPGAFLMLDQQREDTGSAAALINCAGLVFGSAGMVLVFLDANHLVFGIGAINVAVGGCVSSGVGGDREREPGEVLRES